jgi:hypothetical protein
MTTVQQGWNLDQDCSLLASKEYIYNYVARILADDEQIRIKLATTRNDSD